MQAKIDMSEALFDIYFYLLVQILTISVNLGKCLKLGECARVVVQGDGNLDIFKSILRFTRLKSPIPLSNFLGLS